MSDRNDYAPYVKAVRYADLWKLLRRLGYDCDTLGTNPLGARNTVRICEHAESGSRITLADYPQEEFVWERLLPLVRNQLDAFGLMTREEFDRWVKRRARANAAGRNGAPADKPARKRRVPGSSD